MLRILTFCLGLIIALPATAQNAYHDGFANHNIACFGPRTGNGDGLRALWEIINDQVTNSQQVYNVSSFWNDNHGRTTGDNRYCDVILPERSWTTSSQEANNWGVWGWTQVGFLGYIVTDRWLVPVDVIGFKRETINGRNYGDQLALRPARVYDRRQFDLSDACYSLGHINIDGVAVYGLRDAAISIVDRYGNQAFRLSFCRSLVAR